MMASLGTAETPNPMPRKLSNYATRGTVTENILETIMFTPATIEIEHPSGCLPILLNRETAGVIRTARRLFAGEIYIPEQLTHADKAAYRGDIKKRKAVGRRQSFGELGGKT
jgi:hypothetical protein